MRGHDLFRWAAIVAVLLCYTTIILGGNVMASDSGLACPDWPTCHGSFLPPLSGGTGIEWAHRLSALVLSFAILVLTALALAFERSRPVLLRLTAAAMASVVAQALLGGVVVESDLTVGIVLLHLGLATVLFGILLLLVLLANLREIPKRWVVWARQAAEDRPVPEGGGTVPEPTPGPVGAVGIPPFGP
ncbi:MAG TPA: COX15/CtaA family protein [Thermoplasmata archaeon]|nr:COX15/CtaA family protein [Thermoplasmata archaeon]